MNTLAVMAVFLFVVLAILVRQVQQRGLDLNYLLLPKEMKEWASPNRPRWVWTIIIPFGLVLLLVVLMMQSMHPSG